MTLLDRGERSGKLIKTLFYENLNRSERICKLCNSKSVECEYHFLLVCPFYRELRQNILDPTIVTGQLSTNLML